ncbi:MAG: hypothetical protein ACRDPO_14525 [Streptosporangiaceae bacterium]
MAVFDVAGGTEEAVGSALPPAPSGRAGFGGTLRSEFTKIRSPRSTYWTLLALVVITIAIGALGSFAAATTSTGADRTSTRPTAASTACTSAS